MVCAFDQTLPRTSAMPISMPLRIVERLGHRKRFLAVCMVIVDAPREGPCAPALFMTSCKASQSTPSFRQNLASSDAITEATVTGAMSFSGTVDAFVALAFYLATEHERRDRRRDRVEREEPAETAEQRQPRQDDTPRQNAE